jgi:Protein of unknown function (DUF2840)
MRRYLTRVRLVSLPRRNRIWLRFGNPVSEFRHSNYQRFVYFTPQAVFATVRWHGNEYGTVLWHLSILRAISPGETASQVADVDPGAEVLLRVSSTANVRRVLSLIHTIEARKIEVATVNSAYWRTVQNRLIARDVVPDYGAAEHAAHLTRIQWMQ